MTYVWNLSTREEYVVKRPLDELIRSRNYDEKTWRKEAEIMQSITHVSMDVPESSCLLILVANARDLRSILLRSEVRLSRHIPN